MFLGLIAVIGIVFFAERLLRRRLRPILDALNAGAFFNSIWFRQGDVTLVAVMTSPYGTYSVKRAWNQAKANRFVGGFAPLFELYVPVQTKEFWGIRRIGESMLDKVIKSLSSGGKEGVWSGQRFHIWAQNPQIEARIEKNMEFISEKFQKIFPDLPSHFSLGVNRDWLFYRGTLHFGWFVTLNPMPENLNSEPEKFRYISQLVLEILKEIGVEVKV